ncbi:hypothetical protein DEEACLCL_00161 [Salmonella phage CRW-SP2]|nr:hypothetical protein DEEACLCL_00161 [Salmonella phage CRW-SP2]
MSCISIPYTRITPRDGVIPTYFTVLQNIIQKVIREATRTNWLEDMVASNCLVPSTRHFNSLNILNVSDVQIESDMRLVPSTICLPDMDWVNKISISNEVTDIISFNPGTNPTFKQYRDLLFQAYPMLETYIPPQGNSPLIKIYFFDVVSIDHNHTRLTFLTNQDAQAGLDMIKGAF